MIDLKPKTYNEILRLKNCYRLTYYFSNITENLFNEIYNFLGQSSENFIVANKKALAFVDSTAKAIKTIQVESDNDDFDIIKLKSTEISVTPHYNLNYFYASGNSTNDNY